jgi:ATP-dependent protease ClpP protease subunit
MLLQYDLLDWSRLEKRAMHRRVDRLARRYRGRCVAMAKVANEFRCSYQKVRRAVYEMDRKKSNFGEMESVIKIKNDAEVTVIDIEGTIGLSESWQFDNPESRVATYERFKECVARIADVRNSHIRVNIRSTGGDVNDAMLIYEALRATGAEVTTCCYGYTASAATIVAQAASEGCRLIAPTSLYLVHNSLCSVEGNAEEIEAEVELLRRTDERIAEIYARHSGRDKQEMVALMAENGGRGRWLSPAEVVMAGLADAVEGADAREAAESRRKRPVNSAVTSLLELLGIKHNEDAAPNVEDDINYFPREGVEVVNAADLQTSTIAFEEQQRGVKPTAVKAVEDPDLRDMPYDERKRAYDNDARAMRVR